MISVRKYYGAAALLSLLFTFATAQKNPVRDAKSAVGAFEQAARDYVAMRERIRKKLPKLSDNATPEQIAVHKESLQKQVLAARSGAKQGDLFNPAVVIAFRRVIKENYRDWDRSELRKVVLQAENKGVALRVNAIYPMTEEVVEMSPALLLALPQLPPELRYRFVGTSLLLMDRDSRMILDFMKNALP